MSRHPSNLWPPNLWLMSRKAQRAWTLAAALSVLAAAAALTLAALEDSIIFFHTPGEIAAKTAAGVLTPGTRLRLGGMVEQGSVRRGAGTQVFFTVTDFSHSVRVSHAGLLPDLFSEGAGVVAEGALDAGGVFRADTVLAKHDETYMPPAIANLAAGGPAPGPAERSPAAPGPAP